MASLQHRLASTAVASALLAALAVPAFAQTAAPAAAPTPAAAAAPAPQHERFQEMRKERMARMEKFAAELKAKLQLTSEQEGAWTTFQTAMKPQPPQGGRPDFKNFKNLTTPERIDQMRAMRTQRAADADRRDEAVKAFYAQLTPAQQKTFDTQTLHYMHHMGPRHGGPGKSGAAPQHP